MDSAENKMDLNESIVPPSSFLEMEPSESTPSTISEQSSVKGPISTEKFMNEIVQEMQVRNIKDKNETENDNELVEFYLTVCKTLSPFLKDS